MGRNRAARLLIFMAEESRNAGKDFQSGWDLNVVPICPRCGSQECYALDAQRVECFQCHEVWVHPVLVPTAPDLLEEKAA